MKYRDGLQEDIGNVRQIGGDIYAMPMWTPEYCAYVVKRVEQEQAFRRGQGYAGTGEHKAIRTTDVKLVQLPDVYKGYLHTYHHLLREIIKKIWLVALDPSDAFVTRYTMSTQTNLLQHIDQSSIASMTIKLNDDYTGGALYFPRQKLSNESVPVGDMVFFPSGCTHVHEVLPLESGKRFAITFWTQPHVPK